MSLTILSQPSGLQSSNNDSTYTVSGTTYLSPNTVDYKFVANIFVNGGSTPVCTLKSFPDVNFGFGDFNLKRITAQLLSADFFAGANTSTFNQATHSWMNVNIQYGEEYTSGQTFVQTSNIVGGAMVPYINASLPFIESINTNLQSTYTLGTTSGSPIGKFLSTSQSGMTAFTDATYYLYFFNNGNSLCNYLLLNTYDQNNNLIGRYGVSNPYTASKGVQYVSVSPYNSYSGVTTFSGPAMWSTGNEASYSVSVGSASGTTYSETKLYTISSDCGRYANSSYSVYWLNELGGFSTWLFNRKSETTQSKETATYKKTYGTLNANGTYTTNTYSPSVVPYYTKLQDSIEMNTDALLDTDVLYLQGLASSPVVYIQGHGVDSFDNAQVLVSATIKEKSFQVYKKVNQKIFSIKLTMEPSYNDFRQAQ